MKVLQEADPQWVNLPDAPLFVNGGARFLWLSERDGFRHIYLYSTDGALVRQLTRGEYEVAAIAGLGIDFQSITPEERDLQLRQGVARLLDSELASPLAKNILQKTGLVNQVEVSQSATNTRSAELRGTQNSALDAILGQSIFVGRNFGKIGLGYKATFDRIQNKPDLIHQLQLRYPFYKGVWLYGSRELDSKENLGRDPESIAGVEIRSRFDPSDWFKKDDKKQKRPSSGIKVF